MRKFALPLILLAMMAGSCNYKDSLDVTSHEIDLLESGKIATNMEAIKKIKKELDELEQSLSDFIGRIDDQKVGAMEKDIEALYASDKALQGQLAQIEEYMKSSDSDLRASTEALYGSLEVYQQTISELESIDSRMGDVSDNLDKVQKEFAETLKKLKDDVDKSLAECRKDIKTLLENAAADGTIAENLLNQVQSVAVVPDYSDGSAIVKKTASSLRFELRPTALPTWLVNNCSPSNFVVKALPVMTKSASSADLVSLTVSKAEVSGGQLVLTVTGENLPDEYYLGTQKYCARMCISLMDKYTEIGTEYFPITSE